MRSILEIAAALLSGALHVLTTLVLQWRGVDVVLIGVGWLAYVGWRARTPGVLAAWGMRRLGLGPCARAALAALVIGAVACGTVGALRGTLALDLDLLPLLVLYPLWGLVQQLIVLGILAGNLDAAGTPRPVVILTAALAFSAVHVPDWPLCAATLGLGGLCCLLFLRWRNLWPLGVLHGWLGALFYRWVLDRNPWAELVGALG